MIYEPLKYLIIFSDSSTGSKNGVAINSTDIFFVKPLGGKEVTIKILEGEENFTIKGFAKYEKSYELHVAEEDGYFKNETLEENTQEKSFTLPKIYKNGKNKELISILHKSNLTKNKFL